MPDFSSSTLVRQIATLQRRHPTAQLVTFVPRPQLGMALRTATTRHCAHVAGLTTRTIEQHAETWAGLPLRSSGLRPLEAGPQLFLVAEALQHVEPEVREILAGDRSPSSLLRPLARTFDTLRLHDVSPSEYRTSTAGTDRQAAQADVFAAYEALLEHHSVYDTTRLLEAATEQVQSCAELSETVFALLDTVQLSRAATSFLKALRSAIPDDPPRFYRFGTAPPDGEPASAPPADRAAAQYPDLPYPDSDRGPSWTPSALGRVTLNPEGALTTEEAASLRFWTATGTRREVQAVFEDIVTKERPLDTVEIAFTSRDPYLAIIDALAEHYDISVSLSTGRAVGATRPGQALQGFFDWIAEGFPVSTLIELLRSGLVQVNESIGPSGRFGTLDSPRTATLLAERRYGDDSQPGAGYEKTFQAWIEELETELEDLRAASSEASWLEETIQSKEEKLAAVEALKSTVTSLRSFAQIRDRSPVRPNELAEGAINFLEVLGPTPKPTGPDEEHTPDEAARNRLLERLRTLKEMEPLPARPLRSLAAQMSSWIELTPYVRAQRPQPGEAHVVPLESAGYADRDHLYVVGLDANSTAAELTDDPLLTDEEREALSGADTSLPLRKHEPDTEAWLNARALARHEGTVTMSASTYDVAEDEDRFEAPLYLRLKEKALDAAPPSEEESFERIAHHPLSATPDAALSALDRWTLRTPPPPSTVKETLETTYPWIQAGLQAAQARTSEEYTVYDGLLEPGSYPGLNPLAGSAPVSAGELESYARAPYAYFLRHVLDVDPLDEPALDDVAWLDARDRGAILHETFRRFMSALKRQPTRDDEPVLRDAFTTVLSEKRNRIPPPSEVVFAATKRQLWNDARLFLHAEASRTDAHTPAGFEVGFGTPLHRRQDGDYEEAPTIDLVDPPFQLRGRIDRIDRHPDDRVSLWDYKTGSSRSFEEDDLLDDGRHLQWALYAYAYQELTETSIRQAGYFFTSTGEMGKRLSTDPAEHRVEVAQILRRIGESIAAGAFPVNDGDDLRYSFSTLFHDFRSRQADLRDKVWPDDRPAPPPLTDG